MSIQGGKGRNRRGEPVTPVTDQGYAISEVTRLVKCSNPRCKRCRDGPSHGPYIYERYRDDSGRIHTRYRGKADDLQEHNTKLQKGRVAPWKG